MALAALAGAGGLSVIVPELDLAVSRLFWQPPGGGGEGGFPLSYHPLLHRIDQTVHWLGLALAALLPSAWALGRVTRALPERATGACAFLALVVWLGPIATTNWLFKEHWGRARPEQVDVFGGERAFTRALLPARECERNCSFPSGHASVAFLPLALAWYPGIGRRGRLRSVAVGVLTGLLVGLVRIVEGKHFLSDVLFGGIVVGAWAALVSLAWTRFRPPRRAAGPASAARSRAGTGGP